MTGKAQTLLEDGHARIGVALDVTVASQQRYDEARRDVARTVAG